MHIIFLKVQLNIIHEFCFLMSNNLEAVAKRLDAYPNLSVELGSVW